MATLKIGTKVSYRGSFGRGVLEETTITTIEVCEDGNKYGIGVDEVNWENKDNCTFDLSNGYWCYGTQIVKIVE